MRQIFGREVEATARVAALPMSQRRTFGEEVPALLGWAVAVGAASGTRPRLGFRDGPLTVPAALRAASRLLGGAFASRTLRDPGNRRSASSPPPPEPFSC